MVGGCGLDEKGWVWIRRERSIQSEAEVLKRRDEQERSRRQTFQIEIASGGTAREDLVSQASLIHKLCAGIKWFLKAIYICVCIYIFIIFFFLKVPVMMDEALGYLEDRQVSCFLWYLINTRTGHQAVNPRLDPQWEVVPAILRLSRPWPLCSACCLGLFTCYTLCTVTFCKCALYT